MILYKMEKTNKFYESDNFHSHIDELQPFWIKLVNLLETFKYF